MQGSRNGLPPDLNAVRKMNSMQERYLIIKPSSLGDVIHAFPAVSLLAKHRPDAEIDWVVVPAFADIVRLHPDVDNIIPFPRKELGKIKSFPSAALRFAKMIRKRHYTAVLDLQGLLRSGLIASLAKTKVVYGPQEPKEKIAKLFYGKKLNSGSPEIHAVRRNYRLIAEFLGVEPDGKPETDFLKNESENAKIAELMKQLPDGPVVAIAPGARWPSKCWPVSYFAETANLLKKNIPDCSFLILGTNNEAEMAEKLTRTIQAPCLDLTGKTTVVGLLEAIRASSVLFCNDSGPMHIGAALEVPVVCMFAPTDPVRTGPFSEKAIVLTPKDLPCLKCFRYSCPEANCHRAIPAEKAEQAIRSFITGAYHD